MNDILFRPVVQNNPVSKTQLGLRTLGLLNLFFAILLLIPNLSVAQEPVDCEKAYTTLDINICAKREVDLANEVLGEYLAKASERYASELLVVDALNLSQQAWIKYRKAYCDAIYQQWIGGTIRGAMYNDCMQKLTKLRTHVIWQDYLTYMDSSLPILPEPKL